MSNQLMSNLARVTANVQDPFLRQNVCRVLDEMDFITTEVLPVGQTRNELPRVRSRLCEGGALLVADRGVLGNPAETTVMMSLATLHQMLMNSIDRAANVGRISPSELLTGLKPVPKELADFEVDLGETELEQRDRGMTDVEF
jgi:hypothetical protein